jgi:hypothetical protein
MMVKRRRRIVDDRVDTRVIRACIGGKGVKAIAAELRISPERVENIIEQWTASAVTPELRRQEFIRLLAQIDAVIEGLFPRAVAGEHTAIADLNKIWGRKIGVLGLRAPETAILRVIEETIPRQPTSMDRIEMALKRLQEQRSPAERAAELRRQLAELEPALEQQPPPEPPPAKNGGVVIG